MSKFVCPHCRVSVSLLNRCSLQETLEQGGGGGGGVEYSHTWIRFAIVVEKVTVSEVQSSDRLSSIVPVYIN